MYTILRKVSAFLDSAFNTWHSSCHHSMTQAEVYQVEFWVTNEEKSVSERFSFGPQRNTHTSWVYDRAEFYKNLVLSQDFLCFEASYLWTMNKTWKPQVPGLYQPLALSEPNPHPMERDLCPSCRTCRCSTRGNAFHTPSQEHKGPTHLTERMSISLYLHGFASLVPSWVTVH